MRRYLWLETDSAYKSAVEAISRKRAAMRNINQNEQLDDFAHADAVHVVKPFHKSVARREGWTNRYARLSAIFAQYPDVKTSEVELQADAGGYYVVNSERHRSAGAGETWRICGRGPRRNRPTA